MVHKVDDLIEQLLQLFGSLEHGLATHSMSEEILVQVDKPNRTHYFIYIQLTTSPVVL